MTDLKHTDTSCSDDLVERLRRTYERAFVAPNPTTGVAMVRSYLLKESRLINPDGPEAADRIEALQQRVRELEDSLSFIAKWVERGLFCKTTSPQDAISLIAHYPGMPWHSQRWDVDHKPYAEAFYKAFPNAKGDTHD